MDGVGNDEYVIVCVGLPEADALVDPVAVLVRSGDSVDDTDAVELLLVPEDLLVDTDAVELLLVPGDVVGLILGFGEREDDTDVVELLLRPGDAEYVGSSVCANTLASKNTIDMIFIYMYLFKKHNRVLLV